MAFFVASKLRFWQRFHLPTQSCQSVSQPASLTTKFVNKFWKLETKPYSVRPFQKKNKKVQMVQILQQKSLRLQCLSQRNRNSLIMLIELKNKTTRKVKWREKAGKRKEICSLIRFLFHFFVLFLLKDFLCPINNVESLKQADTGLVF